MKQLQLDDHLCFSLYAASHLFTKLYRERLESLGITYPQYLVLLALGEAGPLTIGELGARLYLDSGTLTPLCKRLERDGIVVRARDKADERRVNVTLTKKGRTLHTRSQCVPQSLIDRGLHKRVGDLGALRANLQALVALLADA